MDPNAALKDVFMFIGLPILGLAALWAGIGGHVKVVGMLVVTMLVASAFVFVPSGTVAAIGSAMAAGILSIVNGTLG